jgi:hypothetical protein
VHCAFSQTTRHGQVTVVFVFYVKVAVLVFGDGYVADANGAARLYLDFFIVDQKDFVPRFECVDIGLVLVQKGSDLFKLVQVICFFVKCVQEFKVLGFFAANINLVLKNICNSLEKIGLE